MNALFESSGLAVAGNRYPALSLHPGEIAGWQSAHHADSTALFDMVTGLTPLPAGGVVWFGRDLSQAGPAGILACMRRIAPLTWDGGLLENLNIAENILLPYLHRRRGTVDEGNAALQALLDNSPAGARLGKIGPGAMPHELKDDDRPLVAVLRAALLRPEAIIACEVMHSLDHAARQRLDESLAWLRTACPGAGWLILQTGSALPGRIEGRIITSQV